MNAIIYNKFITKFVKRRYSQFAFIALVRSGMVLSNLEFLWLSLSEEIIAGIKLGLILKTKEEQEKQKLVKMQKPTSQAISEQVLEALDKQLPGQVPELVVASALRTSSKRKRRGANTKKHQSNKGTTSDNSVRIPTLESALEFWV